MDLLFYKLYVPYERKRGIPIESSILFHGITRMCIYLFLFLAVEVFFGVVVGASKVLILASIAILEAPWLIWNYKRYYDKEILG